MIVESRKETHIKSSDIFSSIKKDIDDRGYLTEWYWRFKYNLCTPTSFNVSLKDFKLDLTKVILSASECISMDESSSVTMGSYFTLTINQDLLSYGYTYSLEFPGGTFKGSINAKI